MKTARTTVVETKSRTVKLDSGEFLPFDKHLIASGSVPNRPPLPGIESAHVHPAGRSPMRATSVIISATGVKPNIVFLQGSGIERAQGILVNEYMETNVSEIFAAGDVSQSLDFCSGKREVNAIQPVAADEARIAALNMAGKSVAAHGNLAMNVLDSVRLIASSFGQWWGVPKDQGGAYVEIKDEAAFKYLRLEFKNDLLIGATSLVAH